MTLLMRKSITLRTSLLFTLLAAVVFAFMGLVIRASVSHHFSEQDSSALEGKLELIRHILLTNESAATLVNLTYALVGLDTVHVSRLEVSVRESKYTVLRITRAGKLILTK